MGCNGSIGEPSFLPSNPHILTRAATPHSHAAARDPHRGSLGGLASVGPACPHPASTANLFLDLPAGLGSRRLPAAGHRSEQSGARATSSLRCRLWPAALGCPRYLNPTCGHLPPASARQRGSIPRWGSRCSTTSRALSTCVAASRTLGPSLSLPAIHALMASLHVTWRPLLLLLLLPMTHG